MVLLWWMVVVFTTRDEAVSKMGMHVGCWGPNTCGPALAAMLVVHGGKAGLRLAPLVELWVCGLKW